MARTTSTIRKTCLLVGIDFSPASKCALEVARGLAKDLGATIVLLHASPPSSQRLTPKGKRAATTRVDPATADAEELSATWADELRRDGIDVEATNPVAYPVQAILDEAARRQPIAIVVGTTGPGPMKEFLIGSVAQDLLRRSKVPVLVAPLRMVQPRKGAGLGNAQKLILAPVDFSSDSERSFTAATALAKDLKCVVRALHVVPLPQPSLPVPYSGVEYTMSWLDKDEEIAAEEIAKLASKAKQSKVGVVPSVQVGHPAWVILAEARQAGASLIVMGTHGKTGARRFFLGSVAQTVVQLADRPVLVVPDPKAADAGDWRR